jgi:hypothetical protein
VAVSIYQGDDHVIPHQVCAPGALVCSALAGGSGAARGQHEQRRLQGAKDRIEAEYKAQKDSCDKLKDNAKDVCREEAEGQGEGRPCRTRVQRTGDPKDSAKLAMAKADAAYEVAKERCDDRSGNDKDVCVKEAKANHTKATADAKANKKVAEVRKDAADDKRNASYNLAKEKCDALSATASRSAWLRRRRATARADRAHHEKGAGDCRLFFVGRARSARSRCSGPCGTSPCPAGAAQGPRPWRATCLRFRLAEAHRPRRAGRLRIARRFVDLARLGEVGGCLVVSAAAS